MKSVLFAYSHSLSIVILLFPAVFHLFNLCYSLNDFFASRYYRHVVIPYLLLTEFKGYTRDFKIQQRGRDQCRPEVKIPK